jgi:hypothetical protein
MLVIIRSGAWELIRCPQDAAQAWLLADVLTNKTGVRHTVGRL